MAFKQFTWVPDGTYDYNEFLVRYVIVDCNPTIVISKEWIDKGGPPTESPDLKRPWGTYPDFPPKPPKKLT
jgi:hypothetical protein